MLFLPVRNALDTLRQASLATAVFFLVLGCAAAADPNPFPADDVRVWSNGATSGVLELALRKRAAAAQHE
jgi:hypothetical protein